MIVWSIPASFTNFAYDATGAAGGDMPPSRDMGSAPYRPQRDGCAYRSTVRSLRRKQGSPQRSARTVFGPQGRIIYISSRLLHTGAMARFGGIEAGGTKFVCGVGTGPDDLERIEFPTTNPTETLDAAIDFFRQQPPVRSIGIACFGPIDLSPESPTFGYITSTPKTAWRNFDIAGEIKRALQLPVGFETHVRIGSGRGSWGAARGLTDALYLTVGTGIGGGAVVGGRLLHGLVHPEMGQIRVPHDRQADPFEGCCPFHGDCLEGLASGKAIETRWGDFGQQLCRPLMLRGI